MIVTARFVFLHLHKSGGTFVNRGLLEHLPGARRVGYHLPRADIPAEAAGLPVLGTVRNPWEYYVSWCAFQAGLPQPNALYRTVSDAGRLGFEPTVRNLLALGKDERLFRAVQECLPESRPGAGLNLARADLAPLAGTEAGFYSFLYRRMFQPGDRVVDAARLRESFPQAMAAAGTDVTPALAGYFARGPVVNASAHAHYAGYYSTGLRDAVRRADAAVIEAHGFRFEPRAG